MFFAGLLSLGLRPMRLPALRQTRLLSVRANRAFLWVVALIALDALLGSWLYGGYIQALGRMLVDIETHML
jgi:hypothetical protein